MLPIIKIILTLACTTTAMASAFVQFTDEANFEEFDQLRSQSAASSTLESANGEFLAQLREDKVSIWLIKEKRKVHEFPAEGTTLAVAFSPTEAEVVIAQGKGNLEFESTIKAWNLDTGKGRMIGRCLGTISDLSFSPDGKRIATMAVFNPIGSLGMLRYRKSEELLGGRLNVWQTSNGKELLKIDVDLPGLRSQLEEIRSANADEFGAVGLGERFSSAYESVARKYLPIRLRFSPSGERIVTTTESAKVNLFDSTTGERLED